MKKILSIMVVICMALSLFATMTINSYASMEGIYIYTVKKWRGDYYRL